MKKIKSVIKIFLLVMFFYFTYFLTYNNGKRNLRFVVKRSKEKPMEKKSNLNEKWLLSRAEAMKRYRDKKNVHIPSKERVSCPLPQLNAFDENLVSFMEYAPDTCRLKKYGVVKNNIFMVEAKDGITKVYLQYIRRGAASYKEVVTQEKNKLDDEITLSDRIQLQIQGGYYRHELTEDFIRVAIYFGGREHVEHHATLANTKEKVKGIPLEDVDTKLKYNVVLYMIDSLSHANFKRQLIMTDELMSNDSDTIMFNGQTIVGDGTTAALSALFTGIPEHRLPETRRAFTKNTCDQYKMIFKDFEKKGYLSLFSEEDTWSATFNYRLNGFINPPSSWYLRPFFQSLMNQRDFINNWGVCGTEQSIEVLKTFLETFEKQAKLAVAVTALISHNNINSVQAIDKQMKELYLYLKNNEKNKDTIFVLFGDHGLRYGLIRNTLQGKLEERLPFLSVTLPSGFKEKHKEMYDNLLHNSNLLTTPFDIYMTLQHLLTYPEIPKPKSFGQSLFMKIDGEQRTCANAGVEDHWCPCFNKENLKPESNESTKIVNIFIEHLNHIVSEFEDARENCAKLSLASVRSISKRTANNEVHRFVESKRNDVCDSCGVVQSEKEAEKSFVFYEASFIVAPSDGAFEASGRFQNGKLIDTPIYSRTNKYGDQPSCISQTRPHLRPYCYCKQNAL